MAKKKPKVLREVLFDEEVVEETPAVEEGVLTRDQFFQKVPSQFCSKFQKMFV